MSDLDHSEDALRYRISSIKELLKESKKGAHQVTKVITSYSPRTKQHTTIVFFDDDDKVMVKRGYHEKHNIEAAVLWAYYIKNSGLTRTQSKKKLKELIGGD